MGVQSKYLSTSYVPLEGHTKSVLIIRGTCYQYWLRSVHELGAE